MAKSEISRRDFLKGIGKGAGLAALVSTIPVSLNNCATIKTKPKKDKGYTGPLENIEDIRMREVFYNDGNIQWEYTFKVGDERYSVAPGDRLYNKIKSLYPYLKNKK